MELWPSINFNLFIMKRNTQTKTILSALLIGLVVISSCSKDREEPAPKIYPEENPLTLYLKNSGFDQKYTNYIDFDTYEFGYYFQPKVRGKINAVTFRIPDKATNVRVTIWDVATKIPLRTTIIPNALANTEIRQNIDPLEVTPNTNYLLSCNGNDYYYREKTNGSDTTYPIEAGNILIMGYRWDSTTSAEQKYPANAAKYFYAGDLSIVFQQTE
jgi:hypothetical protein